ncbi:hypothetical protein [Methanopyrus kandleri]
MFSIKALPPGYGFRKTDVYFRNPPIKYLRNVACHNGPVIARYRRVLEWCEHGGRSKSEFPELDEYRVTGMVKFHLDEITLPTIEALETFLKHTEKAPTDTANSARSSTSAAHDESLMISWTAWDRY